MKETMKKKTSYKEGEEEEEEATWKKMKRRAYDPEDPRLFDKIFNRIYKEEEREFLKLPVEERRRMVKEKHEQTEKKLQELQWDPADEAAGDYNERWVLTPEEEEVLSTSFLQYADTLRMIFETEATVNAIRGNPDKASGAKTEVPEKVLGRAKSVNWLDVLDWGDQDGPLTAPVEVNVWR